MKVDAYCFNNPVKPQILMNQAFDQEVLLVHL